MIIPLSDNTKACIWDMKLASDGFDSSFELVVSAHNLQAPVDLKESATANSTEGAAETKPGKSLYVCPD